jgi:hypothetical protein
MCATNQYRLVPGGYAPSCCLRRSQRKWSGLQACIASTMKNCESYRRAPNSLIDLCHELIMRILICDTDLLLQPQSN